MRAEETRGVVREEGMIQRECGWPGGAPPLPRVVSGMTLIVHRPWRALALAVTALLTLAACMPGARPAAPGLRPRLGRPRRGYEYARVQNPTREALEANVAALEGGRHGVAFASGLAAIEAVVKCLSAGDHVVSEENVYGGTYRMFTQVLARLGIEIGPERYAHWAAHRERGGWPTLNCLMEMGLVADYREYFDRYFGPGRPAYVETAFIAPGEAIAAIKAAGGVPVLAHPGAYDPAGRSVLEREDFLDEMVALGIEGLEVYSQANPPAVREFLLAYCRRHDLLVTGGSDCHGDFIPARRLGIPPVPDEYLEPLLRRLRPGKYVRPASFRPERR